MTVTALN